ncbi:MAG: AAA family ATPase [Candidatus Sigynarchaeum springense]
MKTGQIKFDNGFSAIHGANDSGKSNILEAFSTIIGYLRRQSNRWKLNGRHERGKQVFSEQVCFFQVNRLPPLLVPPLDLESDLPAINQRDGIYLTAIFPVVCIVATRQV